MTIYCQIHADGSFTTYGCPQRITEDKPGYCEIEDPDPRYLAFEAAQNAPPLRYVTKNTVLGRMTPVEFTTLTTHFPDLPLIDQWLFNHATEIDVTDLRIGGFLTTLFGADRTAVLLGV